MPIRTRRLAVLVVCLSAFATIVRAQDLRQQFGTRSLEAAKALDQGIKLANAGQSAQAIELLDKAIATDSNLQLAYYWKGIAQVDAGKIVEAVTTHEQLLAVAERTAVGNVTIDACINMGLTLGKAQEEKDAALWLTKAVMLDPDDTYGLRWKAMRNMAISRAERGDHLSAGLCAMLGYLANPQRVELKMMNEFLDKAEDGEHAQVLSFPGTLPDMEADRPTADFGKGTELSGLPWVPTRLMVDAAQNRIVAVGGITNKYVLIESGKSHSTQTVEVAGPINASTLVGRELFLCIGSDGLHKVEIATGKTLQKWALSKGAPTSIAVFPTQGIACFPIRGVLHTLDLDSGKIEATAFQSSGVAADPRQEFCYSFSRPDPQVQFGHVIINGRPVLLQSSRQDWLQTALFKYAIARKKLIMAEGRMNAASNGQQLQVALDGSWVGVVGGGGWRPQEDQGLGAGYGVAVFPGFDFAKPQGFFASGADPIAAAFNPVTQQFVSVHEKDAKVYSLGNAAKFDTLDGPHGNVASWSGDGRHLYVASKTGLRVWPNKLTDSEEKRAGSWWREVEPKQRSAPAEAVVKALDEFKEFTVSDKREDVLAAIQKTQAQASTEKPREWLQYPPYQKEAALKPLYQSLINKNDRENAGIRVYQLEKAKQTHGEQPGIEFLLGMAHFAADRLSESTQHHQTAIRLDQGRTNITIESLRCLGQMAKREDKPLAAAYCYAHVLRLDIANPTFLREAEGMFESAQLLTEAKPLLDRKAEVPGPTGLTARKPDRKLPPLKLAEGGTKLSADKLFAKSAPSVVSIRTSNGGGSGVCVAPNGIVLTNEHVIRGATDTELRVQIYGIQTGKLVRLKLCKASVLFVSEEHDLALLEVAEPPATLVPLPIAKAGITEGKKVFAVGSPGLGSKVLEQSITEGIVSSAERELDGQVFVQHTAAVNPGNSGGPLFNDQGHIAGIVTLKAGLENVSFAIPAARLLQTLQSETPPPAK